MELIPTFDHRGLLPPGDYAVTFDQLRESVLVTGIDPNINLSEHWDSAWRRTLVDQCEVMVNQLWTAGINDIFLDGSFVEQKAHPNDIDGYFTCDVRDLASGDLQRRLNTLDPHKVWTWDAQSRRAYRGYDKKQLPMWHHYRTELYPHYGQSSGIRDVFGHEMQFPSAFRQQRNTGEHKGVIQILKGGRST
jgi:hypothetical protein